jgi:hypothetical protein
MTVNGFNFERLDIRKNNIDDPILGVPTENGIYQWVYYPQFDEQTIQPVDLIDLLKTYSKCNFYIEEELKGLYKFQAKIWEQGYKDNDNIFGLSNKMKKELESFLNVRNNIGFFSTIFQEVCFARPFYLGKANDLKQRLSNHFNGAAGSPIVPAINAKGIPEKDIWVGYKIITPYAVSDNINKIFEEIYSRKVKPGLTIKPN